MPLYLTIEKAAAIAGSQAKLAELLGEHKAHITNWKAGTRTCTIDKRIKLAQIAGLDPTMAVLEGLADQLDENDEWQGKAKETLNAILNAFPEPEPPEMKVNTSNKRQSRYLRSTGYSPVFFCPLRSARKRRTTIKDTPKWRAVAD